MAVTSIVANTRLKAIGFGMIFTERSPTHDVDHTQCFREKTIEVSESSMVLAERAIKVFFRGKKP
jgi:hypothetical protein